MAEEKRQEGLLGRRELDRQHCVTHDDCLAKIDANTKEICWMRKLMMGTLVTAIFTLLGTISCLIVLVIGHVLKG